MIKKKRERKGKEKGEEKRRKRRKKKEKEKEKTWQIEESNPGFFHPTFPFVSRIPLSSIFIIHQNKQKEKEEKRKEEEIREEEERDLVLFGKKRFVLESLFL